ncbi:dynein 11 kDa light chain, flagellar outer arm-like isoform X1 [Triticum dicoccoides]|nr:dynein 11 kDa light chain, flagellar outer arm-like isoform X1 [Triticum dicoccoides]
MDPASEELKRRSHYLSSLIRRTKLNAAPARPPPTSHPEPETKLEQERSPIHRTKLKLNAAPALPPSTTHPETRKLEREPGCKSQNLVEAKVVVEEKEVKEGDGKGKEERKVSVQVRAADMPVVLQQCAIRLAYDDVSATLRANGKRLALALKKEFDTSYGPAWHCIVGTSFGSYVTHTLGGFLYFSVDKVHILLFRTAVEPSGHLR